MCTTLTCIDLTQVTIPVGPAGSNGSNGAAGAAGTNGTDGDFGGWTGEWVFDSATAANPPATELRFNSGTLSAITSIYVNDTNADSTSYNNFLEAFKNTVSGTSYYGLVKVWKKGDTNTFYYGEITNVVDNGADHTITVTHIQSNGTFSDTNPVLMSFTPSGVDNDADPEIITYNATSNGTTSAVVSSLMSYTIPANTLVTNGDTIDFTAIYSRTAAVKSSTTARILLGGTNITIGSVDWTLVPSISKLKVEVTLTKVTATEVALNMQSSYITTSNTIMPSFLNLNVAFPFVAANTNLIDLRGASGNVANTMSADFLLVRQNDI